MAIDVYWISGSPPSWRVLLALEYKRIEYNSRLLNASTKEHKTDQFLALNPRGQVPVIQHGDCVVRESLAILHYLDQVFPQPGLFGATPIESAQTWQWLMDFEGSLRPQLAQVASIVFRQKTAEKKTELDAAIDTTAQELQALEPLLHRDGFVLGKQISAGDITLYPGLQWLKRALAQVGDNPHGQALMAYIDNSQAFAAWQAKIESINQFENTVPPHWNT